MPNRREFLQTGAAVSALAMNGSLASRASAMSVTRASAVSLRHVIYDNRYAAAGRFAATVGARGVAVHALDEGDPTRFWCDVLEPLWRGERAAVAGTTQFGPLFALERLALERGLAAVLRVEHRPRADGTLDHLVTSSRATLALAAELADTGLDWPSTMGLLACGCDGAEAAPATAVLRMREPMPAPAIDLAPEQRSQPSFIHYYTPQTVQQGYGVALDGPLYTWVIAASARPSLIAERG